MQFDKTMRAGSISGLAVMLVVGFSCPVFSQQAAGSDTQICDVAADAALGLEDYPSAIELHRHILVSHPHNALAHYHLGFAYGMVGRISEEIDQYHRAANLGLKNWELFLNLGLAYSERGQLASAADALEHAVFVAPQRVEAHFNLALIYEREGELGDALQEINISQDLAPDDPDVANTKAILCMETGDFVTARNLWTTLVRTAPSYAPARENLAILSRAAHAEPPYSANSATFSRNWQRHGRG